MTAVFWRFNVLVITYRSGVREVLSELRELGRFKMSSFRDVIVGRVEDLGKFFEELERKLVSKPSLPLSRVVPLDTVFKFNLKTFMDDLKEHVKRYLEKFTSDESFCVRVERRGFKGILSSREIEVEIGRYVQVESERILGRKLRVNLEKPDKIICIQILGEICGTCLIPRELMEKYDFIRVK